MTVRDVVLFVLLVIVTHSLGFEFGHATVWIWLPVAIIFAVWLFLFLTRRRERKPGTRM